MTITIENTSLIQLDELYKIETECFKREAFSKRQIAQLLATYNSVGLVAKDGGRIVGFIIGIVCEDRKKLTGHVLTIDVSPSQRRKGVGERLLHDMERIFKERGIETSLLEVREGNVAAKSLYEKFGYTEVAKLRKYYGHADGICLKKILR